MAESFDWREIVLSAVDPDIESAIDALDIALNEEGYDTWGFQPKRAKVYYTLAKAIYSYFRPLISGIENLPAGRCVVVANHAGQFPFDGLVITTASLLHASPPRLLRGMADRFVPSIPFVNVAFSRSGVVVGDPITCRNLLEAENAILVFPEGTRGSGKSFHERYQLQPFGRGFMRLALQTGAPVVPVSVVGSEESIVSVGSFQRLAKLLKVPYIPIPALLPILGPLAYLPMPTRFHVEFGEPMLFEGPFDDEDEVIDAKVIQVKQRLQSMVDTSLQQREGWFI